MKIIDEKTIKFKTEVVRNTAYGQIEDLGLCDNIMVLKPVKAQFVIEWTVNPDLDEEEYVEIGVWTEGKKVVDYDGVFELPKEAFKLLEDLEFDMEDMR